METNEFRAKRKGILTELQCITAFNELGYYVSLPYGDNCRYDLIADINGRLIKVQVKSSRHIGLNSIKFDCRNMHTRSGKSIYETYNNSEIDYFCTYYNGLCYLIPVDECNATKNLMLGDFSKQYELQNQINQILLAQNEKVY